MGGTVLDVVKQKNSDEVKTIDALRIKKYYSIYISQNKTKSFQDFVSNCRAPIEHFFDDHTSCDPTWCWAKSIDERLHHAITKTVNEKNISVDEPTPDTIPNEMGSMEYLLSTDLLYDALKNYWLDALDIENRNGDDVELEDVRQGDEEYTPASDEDNDDCTDESFDDDDDDVTNFMMDDLHYEIVICDVIDNYSIKKMVFY